MWYCVPRNVIFFARRSDVFVKGCDIVCPERWCFSAWWLKNYCVPRNWYVPIASPYVCVWELAEAVGMWCVWLDGLVRLWCMTHTGVAGLDREEPWHGKWLRGSGQHELSSERIHPPDPRKSQEVCLSWGGRPGLPVPNSPHGLWGRKATLNCDIFVMSSGAVWKSRWLSWAPRP